MISEDRIQFGGTSICYTITQSSRRKNITFVVYPGKQVEVKVPLDMGEAEIRKQVRKKAQWIIKKLDFFENLSQIDSSKEYVIGETYLYLGRQYRLRVIRENGKNEAKLRGKYLEVTLTDKSRKSNRDLIRIAVWEWYRNQSHKKIGDAIKRYCKKIGINIPSFIIKNQYKRWGSCTSKNNLIFNFRAVMAPISQLEYIVAHEICHLRYKDHSTKFWKQLYAIMPDYQERKERLQKDGWQYSL